MAHALQQGGHSCGGYPQQKHDEDCGNPPLVRHQLCEQSAHLAAKCPAYRAAVDPLEVLPDEVLLRILSLLTPKDLAVLGVLGYGWRRLAGDGSLWRDVTLDLDKKCDTAVLLRAHKFGWRLRDVCISSFSARRSAKVHNAVFAVQPRRLKARGDIYIWPHGSLEELELYNCSLEDLDGIRSLHNLRRLRLRTYVDSGNEEVLGELLPPQLEWLALDLEDTTYKAVVSLEDLPMLRELTLHFNEEREAVGPLPMALEALSIENPTEDHIRMIHNMRRLRKLELCDLMQRRCRDEWDSATCFPGQLEELCLDELLPPLEFLLRLPRLRKLAFHPVNWDSVQVPTGPLLPQGHPGLHCLAVSLFHGFFCDESSTPAESFVALLQATQAKLQTLEVFCSPSAEARQALVSALRQCQFGALRLLRLVRNHHCCCGGVSFEHKHHGDACALQVQAASDALTIPSVTVVCELQTE